MLTSDIGRPENPEPSPRDLGYAMPAEWSRHRATWLSWPHNQDTWPGAFETVEPAYREIVKTLVESEPVIINVLDEDHRDRVRRYIGSIGDRVRFALIPTNDAWSRDHGATFIQRAGHAGHTETACVGWVYTAWGGKYPPFDLDALVAGRMAELLGLPLFSSNLSLEGGAIEVNGSGILMTTESCALNQNRNPGLNRTEVASELLAFTGTQEVLWLPGGDIEGDDTDGHIDNIARFVAHDTVVIASQPDPADPNHAILLENRRALEARRAGAPQLRLVDIPSPDPVYFEGRRLPASYANFYIANSRVLMPTYRCANDTVALEILQNLFPRRNVVGIDCVELVWGLGAIHCLTQQVPA